MDEETETCPWCKEELSGFCVKTGEGLVHTWCKIALLNPGKSDRELWDIIDPPRDPMPLPKGIPWPRPKERVTTK